MDLQIMFKSVGNDMLTPLLCDEHGEPLPGQVSLDITTAVDETATVTVTFSAVRFSLPPGSKV